MGGGTKEKVARLAAESKFSAEMIGLRTLFLMIFACLVFFSLSLAINLSMSLESPAQQAALFTKLAKERAERAERWKKRNAEHLALSEKSKDEVSSTLKRESDNVLPPWATPRDLNVKKKKKKGGEDEADEFNEEEAELEVRAKMGEWIREATQMRAKAIVTESPEIISLRKRQQFVEDGLDAVTARDPELDDFDLTSLEVSNIDASSTSSSSSTFKHTLTNDQNTQQQRVEAVEKEEPNEPIVGASGTNPGIKALRQSNFFVLSGAKDKSFATHLTLLGYSVSSVTGTKSYPLWVLGYGTKCPEIVDPTERHVLVCPYYFPTTQGLRYLPLHSATRASKNVMQEMLTRSRHKRNDGPALSQALADVYNVQSFAPENFRLFKDKAKLEAHLARDEERRPIFVLTQSDGQTQSQLTDNVPQIISKEKVYAAKQLVLRRYSLTPLLWEGKKFVLRSYAIMFHRDPFMVLFAHGPVLRAADPFAKPSAPVETAPASVHFPGSATNSDRFSLVQLVKALGLKDMAYLKQRMRQITAYALLSLGASGTKESSPEDESRSLGVQHLCFDFNLEQGEELMLEAIRTDCTITPGPEERTLIDSTNVLAEEMLFRKTRQEAWSFASLPSFTSVSPKLEVLFDEQAEVAKGRSLLDVLESLVATRKVASGGSTSQQRVHLTCENAAPTLSYTHSFQRLSQEVPTCSSNDLDTLFSTAAVVNNGEEVDEETFFNSKIEQSLKATLNHVFQGNFRAAVQEGRLAGYAPCARIKNKIVSLVFPATSKGLSPFALKVFACSGTKAPDATKHLLIEIPHPFFDHTRQEGLALFDGNLAKALLLSGTHRCAIAPPSKCTGSIGKSIRTNCAGRSEYQNGDVAHSVENTFWVVHVALSEFFASSLVVSLHSTKQESFIISDGTSREVESSTPVAKIAVALSKVFTSNSVVACNDFEGSPNKRSLSESEQDVCGATNVQGRHLNGATDPCEAKVHVNGSPLISSGRFVHIEQPVILVKEEVDNLVHGMERALHEWFA